MPVRRVSLGTFHEIAEKFSNSREISLSDENGFGALCLEFFLMKFSKALLCRILSKGSYVKIQPKTSV